MMGMGLSRPRTPSLAPVAAKYSLDAAVQPKIMQPGLFQRESDGGGESLPGAGFWAA